MSKADDSPQPSASDLISQKIESLGDWRGDTLGRMRALVLTADPQVVEEWKWMGTPVWSHDGILCTGESYKQVVKLTFAKGAALKDPAGLFNASLDGHVRRAIDIHEGEVVDAAAFQALVLEAVALNQAAKVKPKTKRSGPATSPRAVEAAKLPGEAAARTLPGAPTLLSGGNPQIAKADGDGPVQAYIAAMPGWKGELGRRLDALIDSTVPGVAKAVKWNSPFYGVAGQGWFASFHTFTHYVKLTFFFGTSLQPVPPGGQAKEARWVDLREGEFDEAQLLAWIRQAAALPGWGKS